MSTDSLYSACLCYPLHVQCTFDAATACWYAYAAAFVHVMIAVQAIPCTLVCLYSPTNTFYGVPSCNAGRASSFGNELMQCMMESQPDSLEVQVQLQTVTCGMLPGPGQQLLHVDSPVPSGPSEAAVQSSFAGGCFDADNKP